MRWKRLLVLVACLFVATIGFGITLPVLPFYVERFVSVGAVRSGSWLGSASVQVGLLTAIYPLVQLVVAPVWGRLSDSVGRRRLLIAGLAGSAMSYVLFAAATSLPGLYAARALGGLLSSALFPAAAAYVADSTTDEARGRGMAWLGIASSLGAVVGPALGGTLGRVGSQPRSPGGLLTASEFAVPFLAASVLALVALLGVVAWLPESEPGVMVGPESGERAGTAYGSALPLLGLSLAAQFGLALFETTFALFARQMWSYGPAEVGAAFMVCGLVMLLAQAVIASPAGARVSAALQVAIGFGLVGTSLALLVLPGASATVLVMVGAFAFGVALVGPNISALLSVRSEGRAGAALGRQGTANGLGQAGGAALGGLLLGWKMDAPFALAALLFIIIGLWVVRRRHAAEFAGLSAPPSGIMSAPER